MTINEQSYNLAFVFPGQGSQAVGMLGSLAAATLSSPKPSPKPPTRWASIFGIWSPMVRKPI